MGFIVNWKRIIGWSLLIFTAALIVGLVLGTGALSSVGVFVSSTTLYYFFLRAIPVKRPGHLIVAFLIVEAIDWVIPLMLGAQLSHLLGNWDSTAKHLGAALLGMILAGLSSNNSVRKPLSTPDTSRSCL